VKHGVVEVFAYQETLLIMAVFGIAILAMLWVGFRRWLQLKEKMGADMERVEARLNAIERLVTDGGVQPAAQIDALGTNPLPEPELPGSSAVKSSPTP